MSYDDDDYQVMLDRTRLRQAFDSDEDLFWTLWSREVTEPPLPTLVTTTDARLRLTVGDLIYLRELASAQAVSQRQARHLARPAPRNLLDRLAATTARRLRSTRDAADLLITTINVTGGVVAFSDGTHAPQADPEWIDLAEAYLRACEEKGVEPLVHRDIDLAETYLRSCEENGFEPLVHRDDAPEDDDDTEVDR